MHHACENGYPQVVALLLEHRANLSLRTTVAGDNGGLTPFELAIMNNQLEVCKHILNSPSWEKALQPVGFGFAEETSNKHHKWFLTLGFCFGQPPGSASTGPTPMKMMIEHLPEAAYVALSVGGLAGGLCVFDFSLDNPHSAAKRCRIFRATTPTTSSSSSSSTLTTSPTTRCGSRGCANLWCCALTPTPCSSTTSSTTIR